MKKGDRVKVGDLVFTVEYVKREMIGSHQYGEFHESIVESVGKYSEIDETMKQIWLKQWTERVKLTKNTKLTYAKFVLDNYNVDINS